MQNTPHTYAGTREIPKGAANCFQGMTFVVTGELETLERNQVGDIIKRYGGKYAGARALLGILAPVAKGSCLCFFQYP